VDRMGKADSPDSIVHVSVPCAVGLLLCCVCKYS